MNKIEETIEIMNVILNDIKKASEERIAKVSEDSKDEIRQIYNRTEAVMNKSIEKVKEVSSELSSSEELEAFFNNIILKCDDVKKFTIEKINCSGKENAQDLIKIEDEITNLFEEFKENEAYKNVMSVCDNIKQNVQDFLAKPEVQDKIDQIKDKTLDIADKGLDILKRTLRPEDYEQDEVIKPEETNGQEETNNNEEEHN